jgi:hypothetical protein
VSIICSVNGITVIYKKRKGKTNMRKLFTWVLALALIVTMAAPALAITGDLGSDDDLTSIAPVLLDVGLFTTPPTNTAFGGFSVSQIAANKVYIVNEVAYYGVALKFYDPDEDEEIGMNNYDYRGANLELTSDALSLYDGAIKAYVFDKDGRKVGGFTDPSDWKMEDCEWRVPGEKTWKTGNTVYFFGQGIVKAKGVLKAELTKTQKVGADADHALEIYDGDGELVCKVWKVNSGFVVNNDRGTRARINIMKK